MVLLKVERSYESATNDLNYGSCCPEWICCIIYSFLDLGASYEQNWSFWGFFQANESKEYESDLLKEEMFLLTPNHS